MHSTLTNALTRRWLEAQAAATDEAMRGSMSASAHATTSTLASRAPASAACRIAATLRKMKCALAVRCVAWRGAPRRATAFAYARPKTVAGPSVGYCARKEWARVAD